MAAPSDHLRIGSPAEMADALTRSHLSDGRVVGWYGAPGTVIDAELDRRVPPALAARHGATDFWPRWTRMECVAKLTNTPAVLLRRRLDAPPPQNIELTTLHLPGGIVVSTGTVVGDDRGRAARALPQPERLVRDERGAERGLPEGASLGRPPRHPL